MRPSGINKAHFWYVVNVLSIESLDTPNIQWFQFANQNHNYHRTLLSYYGMIVVTI